ncbi:MAG: MotA/TolQ/ExbB proton channel family protein [Lentisphaerae bacterium]|nr:MotA/TolQ/ExbB proton channel family protein [Lentisphaerota bacterium]
MNRTRLIAALALGWAGMLVAAAAQEAAAGAPAETATSLWTLLKQGGLLMWPLGFLSVATIALAVYGFITVRAGNMLMPDLVPRLQEHFDALDLDSASTLCDANPGLLTNVVGAGLSRVSDGLLDVPAMEKAMEEAAVEETGAGLKTISYLSIIAQIAPMVGLLGTVSGMIKAFQKIGKGAMGKPEVLASDIGEALVTTATGLLIGIPAMFLYFYLRSRYTSNVTRLGRVTGNLTHHLVARSRREAHAPAGPAAT